MLGFSKGIFFLPFNFKKGKKNSDSRAIKHKLNYAMLGYNTALL